MLRPISAERSRASSATLRSTLLRSIGELQGYEKRLANGIFRNNVEIVDTDEIDAPVKRYRSDQEVQENPFTDEEWREMRYNDYLQLKEEFEVND